MKVGDLYGNRYLTAADLGGREPIVVMRAVAVEKVKQGRETEERLVLYFENAERGLMLNKTNALAIASLHGEETDAWLGRRIRLFESSEDYDGKTYRVIRIKQATESVAPSGSVGGTSESSAAPGSPTSNAGQPPSSQTPSEPHLW